jgi:hypothetical protein
MLIPIQPVNVDPEKIAFQMCESGEQVTFAQLEERANQAELRKTENMEKRNIMMQRLKGFENAKR